MKKRIVSLLLCVSLVACFPVTASAEPPGAEQSGALPVVIVRGVDLTGIYLDFGTENQRTCLGEINAADIVKTLLTAVFKGVFSLSMDKAVDEILSYAKGLFMGLSCDSTGASLYDVGFYEYPKAVGEYDGFPYADANEMGIIKSAVEHYGGENVYYVNYDWRMDPRDVADEIAASVDRAISETGAQKVNLVSASMGGVMTVAYMTEYGYGKLNKCVFLSSAFYGAKVVSELFKGRVEARPEALYNFVYDNFGGSGISRFFIKTLARLGAFRVVSSVLNAFLNEYKQLFYDELLKECFCHTLSFWALVLPEDYDDCISYIFGDSMDENAEFIAKTDKLQQMMAGRDALLKEAAETGGVQLHIITTYNSAHVPLYPSAVLNGDNGLETAYMSGGARVADYGKALPDEITNSGSLYVSADGVVDASTCLFPDSTWFIKDGPHVGFSYGTDCADFLLWILDYDGQATVFTDSRYPQFMRVDKKLSLYTDVR